MTTETLAQKCEERANAWEARYDKTLLVSIAELAQMLRDLAADLRDLKAAETSNVQRPTSNVQRGKR